MVSYHNTRRVDKNINKSINLSRAAFSFLFVSLKYSLK